jgi:N-methylhydantoinase A
MADLLRRVTTRSGYDPRNFAVFAYGGAGPTHAYHYSSVAGISTVVVPKTASGHSAFGTVTADRHRSFSLAFGQHAPARFKRASDHIDAEALNAGFDQLVARCRKALGDDTQIKRLIGMRFRQQVHQIEVDVPAIRLNAAAIDALVDSFEQRYEQIYGKGTALRMSGVEFITLRVEGLTPVQRPDPRRLGNGGAAAKLAGMRKVYFYGAGFKETPVYRWEDLSPGQPVKGPAIVERPDTTIVIGIGHRAEIEPFGNLLIHLKG